LFSFFFVTFLYLFCIFLYLFTEWFVATCYIPTCLHTYLPAYIPTYLPTTRTLLTGFTSSTVLFSYYGMVFPFLPSSIPFLSSIISLLLLLMLQ
jgi:hypothetical protein